MAITRAPRPRTRSTVRLVSVVVPDWLMAMISVSDMSERSEKPDSSVAGSASTRTAVPATSAASARARLWPATAAVPWPMTATRVMVPAAQPGTHIVGQRLGAEGDAQARRRPWRSCRGASCGTTRGPPRSP